MAPSSARPHKRHITKKTAQKRLLKTSLSSKESEILSLKKKLTSLYSTDQKTLIAKALEYTEQVHAGQYRLNGDPWLIHPLTVAMKSAELGLGPRSICAALFHDTYEDGGDRKRIEREITEHFGTDIAGMVTSLTTIKNNPAELSYTSELLYAQQYLLASVSDLRVMIIKLADKLHNVQTLEGLQKDRQERYLREVQRLYIPIAEYLGLGALHAELQNEVFRYEYPDAYAEIADYLHEMSQTRKDDISKLTDDLNQIADIAEVQATIEGREKSIPSIYHKQQKYRRLGKKWALYDIKDIYAFRIITETVEDCYKVFSALCTLYGTDTERIDDLIAKPKVNGYQSIHLTINHPTFKTYEVQIKTSEMHHFNEYGAATHFAYKSTVPGTTSEDYLWTQSLHNAISYFKENPDVPIELALFYNYVFILTPHLDFLRLQRGATPVDAAYEIHSDIGDHCIGVKINNKSASLDTELKNGDIVEIITNPRKQYATEEWQSFAVSEKARYHIQASLRKELRNSQRQPRRGQQGH